MFVYNNFTSDARVEKEATSLVAAGYEVQIVAVLDRKTVAREERNGLRIVRIDRNPPHYRILRRSRQARRWLRLSRARANRRMRLIRVRTARRWGRLLARILPTRSRAQAPVPVSAGPGVRSPLLPVRLYRAARWRVIRRNAFLRRLYYRSRARRSRRLRGWRYRRRARAALRGSAVPQDRTARGRALLATGHTLLIPFAAAFVGLRWVGRRVGRAVVAAGSWIDRTTSRLSYRMLMRLHKPLMFTDFYRRAYRLVREEGFDIVHAHDLNTLPVAAAIARKTGCKLVYDAHELYPEVSTLSRLESRVWKVVERRLIGRADLRVTVCESIAGEIATRYGVEPPSVLLNCPRRALMPELKTNRLRAAADLEGTNEPIILYQGGFTAHRGLLELLRAAKHLDHGIVVLMGWGTMESLLATRIKELGLEGRVVMIGAATPTELPQFTIGADIGVIPYQAVGLNNYYTTPNKLFEYIAAGIPVAGSHFPELRRVIEGYELGVTFDPDDPEDIAASLNRALADRDQVDAMRANAARAAEDLVWERQEAKLLSLYQGLGGCPVPRGT